MCPTLQPDIIVSCWLLSVNRLDVDHMLAKREVTNKVIVNLSENTRHQKGKLYFQPGFFSFPRLHTCLNMQNTSSCYPMGNQLMVRKIQVKRRKLN